jgi:hypothetical protein
MLGQKDIVIHRSKHYLILKETDEEKKKKTEKERERLEIREEQVSLLISSTYPYILDSY